MTRKEIYEELDRIASSLNEESSKEEIDAANDKAEKLLCDTCHIIHIHAPTLKDMRPAFELTYGKECPHGKDGECYNCDNFVTIKSDDGTIFSFKQFTGYCLRENNVKS